MYEEEADRIAEQVMRMPVSDSTMSATNAKEEGSQRRCPLCMLEIGRKPSTKSNLETGYQVTDEINRIRSSDGSQLDGGTKTFMESRFGYDFSQVKIHADESAATSSKSINALAYTIGNDIVFGQGHYQPHTLEGRRLLAHELTHVVQQTEHSGELIQRQSPTPQDLPGSHPDKPPEIVTISIGDVVVGKEQNAYLSAVQFEVTLNPKGNDPVDYRWSVELEGRDTVQITGIKEDSAYEASVGLIGLKPGRATIFPKLEIRQRNRKPIHVKGTPVSLTVIHVDVLKEASNEYRKYLSDYESFTRRWTELQLKQSKGENVSEKIQEENAGEIKRYELARQRAEEAAKIALDVSKKKKVHDEIGSLLVNIDLAIERIETAKADGFNEAIELLNAEELEKPSNANAFWIALAGNLLWAVSGSLPWIAATALAKMKSARLMDYFKSSSYAATHVSTAIGTVGAMMAQFSGGMPSGGERKAGLKKELLKYFGIINAQVANKQRRMSRLLLLEAMSKEPPTEKMDPIEYVADLSVGFRYTLYGDIYREGLNDGALPDGSKIKDFARDQLLHQYVAGTSAISGGKIAPTAISKLEGENLVEQAINALGGQKALLFEPYELVKNQLHRAAGDIGASIYEPYIDDLITQLMSGRDYYVPITTPNKEKLANLMNDAIVCINTGGVSGNCSFAPLSKEEAKPVVDSIISEGIDRIWVVNDILNKLERNNRTMYSVQRFFLQPIHSTPKDAHQHVIYKVSI